MDGVDRVIIMVFITILGVGLWALQWKIEDLENTIESKAELLNDHEARIYNLEDQWNLKFKY